MMIATDRKDTIMTVCLLKKSTSLLDDTGLPIPRGASVELRTPQLDTLLDKGHNDTTAPLIWGFDFPRRSSGIVFGCWGEYDD